MTIAILFIAILIALAAYLLFAKTRGKNSTKAKRQEKSEIIRQLLALSDQEDHISATPPPPVKLQGGRRGFASSSKKY
jgi:hypothetical protein